MAAQRPRLSVLTLFDPLSSSSESPDSDKENDCGDSSFFHPFRFSKRVYSPVHRLRRRLIDIGDMTVEEPDIRDLIEEELEAEISQTVTLEEDDNPTLTFRDMAKAATPKWSGKHAGRKGTPKILSPPRTPLAEIVTRGDITPVARRKIFKRPAASSIPAASPLNAVHTAEGVPTLVIQDLDNMLANSSSPTFVPPMIFVGDHETTKKFSSPGSMAASTATLEIPISSGALISDTPIPLFVSSSSTEPNHASRAPSPLMENRLRPNAHVSESSNRHSVDLHASFQLHLSSSETTFDLLNDKISFLSSKNGLESFLDNEGSSFCDDEDFGATNHELSSEMVSNEQRSETEESIRNPEVLDSTFEEHVNERILRDIKDRHTSYHGRDGVPNKQNSYALEMANSVPDTSSCKAESGILSTPSPSHPPRPVPALRIVKRTTALEQAKAAERNRHDLRSSSRGKTSNISTSRAPKRTSLEDASFSLTGHDIKNGGQVGKSTARVNQPAGGPQRVLATEVPKVRSIPQAKSMNGTNGPRRVQALETINKKADLPVNNAGKQPSKYASVGIIISGIPKPAASRNSGSRIPAPPGNKQRFGVPGKGFLGRQLGGK